jgi:streptogramin lyase
MNGRLPATRRCDGRGTRAQLSLRPGGGRLRAILLALAVTLGLAVPAVADRGGIETPLAADGLAYEINPDAEGRLYISDFAAGEVRSVDVAANTIKVYEVGGAPSDARPAGEYLWWSDGTGDTLGRVSLADGMATRWKIPDAVGFYGTAVDASGRLWATSAQAAVLYRLDSTQGQVCETPLADGSYTYIATDAGSLWLGDSQNGRLLRLNTSDNRATWWTLPPDSSPLGILVDGVGRLWYADSIENRVGRLDPATGQVALFNVPEDSVVMMLALREGQLCYTAQGLSNAGCLDAEGAGDSQFTSTVANEQLTSTCSAILPASTGKMTITSGTPAWTTRLYPELPAAGVAAFRLPGGSKPWGISIQPDGLWIVDQGRRQLLRVGMESLRKVVLPLVRQ